MSRSKKQETPSHPNTPKQEERPKYGCPHCGGSKRIQATPYPGFEGKPTLPVPCPYC